MCHPLLHLYYACRSSDNEAIRVKHVFFSCSSIKVLITLRRILQGNDGGVDRLGNLHPVMQDRHHQLAMVTHDRTLAGDEREGFCPTQANANIKLTRLSFLVDTAWITGYIQARNTYLAGGPRDRHHVVERCSWSLSCIGTVTARLKADAVNRRVYLGFTEDLCDHIRQRGVSPQVNRFAAETARLCKPFRDQITHDDHSSTQ